MTKCGCDGQSVYKQWYSDGTLQGVESALFITTFLPMQLNPELSTTELCWSVRFELCKDTSDTAKKEVTQMDHKAGALVSTELDVVKFITLHEMVDGKKINIVTETKSSQRRLVVWSYDKN